MYQDFKCYVYVYNNTSCVIIGIKNSVCIKFKYYKNKFFDLIIIL